MPSGYLYHYREFGGLKDSTFICDVFLTNDNDICQHRSAISVEYGPDFIGLLYIFLLFINSPLMFRLFQYVRIKNYYYNYLTQYSEAIFL